MSLYAEGTCVSVEKSRAEIEGLLNRYGADQFLSGRDASMAMIGFRAKGRMVRFVLPLPERKEFLRGPTGRSRVDSAIDAAWEQETRRRWRSLALLIKAKLEAVASKIAIFDDEFMAHIVLPDNSTIGENIRPRIAEAYKTGKMPPLLPGIGQTCAPPFIGDPA